MARLLALAYEIERRFRAGEIEDLARAARVLGLARARVTQIVNLTLLAATIQEVVVALQPIATGREQFSERTLRALASEPMWSNLVAAWLERIGAPRC